MIMIDCHLDAKTESSLMAMQITSAFVFASHLHSHLCSCSHSHFQAFEIVVFCSGMFLSRVSAVRLVISRASRMHACARRLSATSVNFLSANFDAFRARGHFQ